jgi:heat shock protein HslJ
VQDAAVVLSVNTGGSGTFVFLIAVTNNKGQAQQAATVLVGDREPVKALSIKDGKIVATVQAHATKDPLCCPSQEVVRTYELQGDALTMTAERVTAPAAALSGRTWTLAALGAPGAEKLLLAGTTVTVTFGADGKLSGSAGCNSFGGGYTADGKNLAVGALASTKKYCGDITGLMDQESAFLAALASAKTYEVQGNQVVMLDAGGSQILRLKGS